MAEYSGGSVCCVGVIIVTAQSVESRESGRGGGLALQLGNRCMTPTIPGNSANWQAK